MSRFKPVNFGQWWNTNDKDAAWYQEIHDSRRAVHEAFIDWIGSHDRTADPIRSVLEVGCGRGVLYPELFRDKRYVGYDISRKEVEWCRANRANSRHDYIAGDFIVDGIAERFDLVFSHAVVDHVYDIDAFVRALAGASNRWLYVTSYRGWFPELSQHRYTWHDGDTCFYNDLAPSPIEQVIKQAGYRHVDVRPSPAHVEPDKWETLIIAER